jgi:hypothetical protein
LKHIAAMTTSNQLQNEARTAARNKLKELGWSQRHAAEYLSYSFFHFSRVMTGHRVSWTILEKIMALPPCPNPRKPWPKSVPQGKGILPGNGKRKVVRL